MFALIECVEIGGRFVKDQKADIISIFYDVGGIVGECYNSLSNLLSRHNFMKLLMGS